MVQVDELARELAAADSERLLREAEVRAADGGDPEAIVDFDPHAGDGAEFAASLRSIHARQEELRQELAQLSIERGPNFPRVVEIRGDLEDLDNQVDRLRERLRGHLRSALQASQDHVRLVSRALDKHTAESLKVNQSLTAYESMRRESESNRELYIRMQEKLTEAGLSAGSQTSDIWVVDEARPPARPVAPDPPLDFAITLFAAMWIGIAAALLAETARPAASRSAMMSVVIVLACMVPAGRAQAPTPSTSGLPAGVARIPQSPDTKASPDPKEAPAVWNGAEVKTLNLAGSAPKVGIAPLAAPIGPGDLLDVSEFHTPEFHSVVRVSAAGTINLPLVDEVRVEGMDEQAAAQAIAALLLSRGMLNHPQVFVLLTASAGQDVSVLGEVSRPGVYPYGVHHRLLDLISAASGITPYAGAVATVYHRSEPDSPHFISLKLEGADPGADRNPELIPGDVVQVSRAGLVYVVGDVVRPGGFIVDPSHRMTILKAISLAWGPSQNASLGKAILIREQDGGRVVTALNLKRMLRGKDPDQPILDNDILFVPDSMAKNLFNRSVESAIQSAAGVSIYAGLVYSQRF